MLPKCFLNSHTLHHLLLHTIVRLDKTRQHRDNLIDLVLWNYNDTIGDIAKDQIPRVHNSPIKIKRDLNRMGL